MERDVLKFFLRAGPSRKFDVGFFTSRAVKESPDPQLLFANAFLNHAILFKFMEVGEARPDDDSNPVSTLVYMAYDRERPGDGGEGFLFSEENLARYCEYRLAHVGEIDRDIAADSERLQAFDSIPTFSPFIVEMAFQRAGLSIPPAYLQLTPEIRAKLTGLLKSRVRPLIVAAFSTAGKNVEKAVEDLTSKLFCTSEVDAILPLVRALRLSPMQAQDVLTSWLGIAYFEHEYAALQPKLREFASWLSVQEQQHMQRARRDREYITVITSTVKSNIRKYWNEIMEITKEYRRSYEDMVFFAKVDNFIRFLNNAEEYYWKMGEVLGRVEQTIVVWKHYTRRYRNQALADAVYFELLDLLRKLHVQPDPSEGFEPGRLGLWSQQA